ncbi:MAG: outer membrane protein assembly factor BamB [Chromatiaceae bacterium]|nr:outer membrane protein assembly factor BamB [Chromatiaceae bacterium]
MPNHRWCPGRAAALLLVATLVLGLGGCSVIPWFGGEKDPTPPTKLQDFVSEAGIQTLWSERVTKGSEGRRLKLVPAVSGGRVYVADARGRVAALDANSGRVLWERETGLAFSGGPDLDGDRLILGSSGGEVVTLSAANGAQLWRAQLESEVISVPRASGEGKVIVHTLDDSIYGLDAANGVELWRLTYPAPVLTLRGSSSPAITPKGVVVGLSGGKLVKIDPADGTPLWEVTVTPPRGRSELARISDIDADPVVVGTLILVGAANETDLFVTDSDDRIWGADPVNGAGRWKQERLLHRQLTAPALIGNLIAVGDLDGYIHLVAQSDGRLVGRARVAKKGAITARPVAAQGRLYVYGNDGTLAALSVGQAPPPSRRALRNQAAEGGAQAAVPAEAGTASESGIPATPTGSTGDAPRP